ncbi:MAG: asparagine synthase C-terminal domain-containing protein [Thermodesulfobacteriota bacterium]|nr:asparagine synthase C-terminal domain-containing protein [Thermodesulfobacteriota bacterium]
MERTTMLLRNLLIRILNDNRPTGVLLSGGVDSSVLTSLSPNLKAITVSLESWGDDLGYSRIVARALGIEQVRVVVDIDRAMAVIPEVIRILKTFDPAIPNDLVVYFGLEKAKELGLQNIMTGDASDELFAGYSYMLEMDDLETYIRRISQNLHFSSNTIANHFGIEIIQPFIDADFVKFALSVDVNLKVRKDKRTVWGKWILRKAFENMLSQEIIWQDKRPLEYGSGMTKLREIISYKVSDEEFCENPYKIRFINKEHMYYYKIYKDIFGAVQQCQKEEKQCPGCGVEIEKGAFHCSVCGWVRDLCV